MKNSLEDYIMYVLVFVLVVVIVFAFVVYINNNQSGHINDARFTWAIVQLGNGELIEGHVTSWRDFFDESDMIQITIDDELTIMTHSSNVLLCNEQP